ncbi:ascorbase and Cu-oxidase [Ophiocordyceps sinensis CO18]|nr:ascorbase and Cu-oxidase [Ophiocordyceps sinensis CO18]
MVLGVSSFEPLSVESSLPQQKTNGKSLLGTLLARLLPVFLEDNPLPNGKPWSVMDLNTNYYRDFPRTGVIRTYDFTIARGTIAPDGYQRDALLVNGAFPGPLIEANWGDTIQVTVRNNINNMQEGVALHWHGFLQKGKPWEDGVPAVTQCPIPPGKSFTYSFEAELYGTSWYHSHYSSQFSGGLLGPMVIYGPRSRPYDIDVGPVMLSDWYHRSYYDLVKETMKPNGRPFPSNNTLINGKNNFDCSLLPPEDKTPCVSNAGISKFRFKRGKTHRLRLVNTGAEALQRFSIDGHKMTVIANDFVTVEPYETKVVTLGIGQRADVLVKANGTLGAYWMRTNVSEPCSISAQPLGVAAIYYDGADETKAPRSVPWDVPDPGTCANDDLRLTRPAMKLQLPKPDKTYEFEVHQTKNGSDVNLWSFDGVEFRGNYNSPTLLLSNLGNFSFEREWNVKNTKNARSVRVHVKNKTPVGHPMHLHGFNMYVLHEGEGEWDGTIINPQNPQRRDVVQLRPNGHLVMQFDAGANPGVWPFHCHIAWHSSAGFLMQFVTGEDRVRRMRPPNVVAETCRQWAKWTKTNIPDQIDSGL